MAKAHEYVVKLRFAAKAAEEMRKNPPECKLGYGTRVFVTTQADLAFEHKHSMTETQYIEVSKENIQELLAFIREYWDDDKADK